MFECERVSASVGVCVASRPFLAHSAECCDTLRVPCACARQAEHVCT